MGKTDSHTTSYSYEELRQITLRHGGYHPDSKMSLTEAIREMSLGIRCSAAPYLMEKFGEHIQELENAKR